jgi:hypothetical protein
MAAALNLYLVSDFMATTNEPLGLGMRNIVWRQIMHTYIYLQTLKEILFASQQLKTWRRRETLKLYPTKFNAYEMCA